MFRCEDCGQPVGGRSRASTLCWGGRSASLCGGCARRYPDPPARLDRLRRSLAGAPAGSSDPACDPCSARP